MEEEAREILKSALQLSPVGASYIEVARGLMARNLGHPSWADPVNPKPVPACGMKDHPIDCSFEGWTVSYAFDPTNTLTQVCVKGADGKAECSL